MFKSLSFLLPLALLLTLSGCKPEEEEQQAPPPPKVEFKGAVDKAYVGKWRTPNGRLVLTLEESGAASMIGKISSPGGEKDVNTKMEWKLDGSRLVFQNEDSTTSGYKATLKGDKLELATSKTTSVYTKM
ncbi:MAG: hypothetical protein WCK51_02440 [Armatimonadota bacterium]